jgi:hypothetical protein
MSRVFRKTALGIATFTKQNSGLTQSQRALLIMVDGKRSASDLRRFGATFGNVNLLLRELYDGGLIELDPAYVEKALAVQGEIAKENDAIGMYFGAETQLSAARPTATIVGTSKRDLRDLAADAPVASTDAPLAPTIASQGKHTAGTPFALTLTPVSGDSDEELPIAAVSPATLIDVKDFAKRYVFDALGNSGTALCLAIDRADDLKGFMETVKIARSTLRDMKGDSVAQELGKQLREILLR